MGVLNGNDDRQPRAKYARVAGGGAPSTSTDGVDAVRCGRLPALDCGAVRDALVDQLRRHRTTVLMGETGSGKSTQVPKYVVEAGLNAGGRVAVTEPRRVAAVTLARRVAQEMSCQVGQKVGYSVRFEKCLSEATVIHYQTDGMLLREALHDPMLARYSVVVLDEAHERTLHTDIMFGVVKRAQRERALKSSVQLAELKVVVMSATMNAESFAEYFDGAPIVLIEGRLHNVEIMYTAEVQSDYLDSVMVAVFQIHQERPPFVEEIEWAVRRCREVAREIPNKTLLKVNPMQLYAAMRSDLQLRVFDRTKPGVRKIVFATNIAETSVTIPGIRYVIDSGKVKARMYLPDNRVDVLRAVNVSQAQATQRAGRAGRDAPGHCFRLYTEEHFCSLSPVESAEIERCNLSSVILELLSMGVRRVLDFDFMSAPKPEAVKAAARELQLLGAVDAAAAADKQLELTPLGRTLAAFPLEPKMARLLTGASELGCLSEMLTIVAMMTHENVLIHHAQSNDDAQTAHEKFACPEGDHLTLLNLYRTFEATHSTNRQNWCQQNFVQLRNIEAVGKIRKQLKELCQKQNLDVVQSAGGDTVKIRRALCHGFFLNAAELDATDAASYKILDSGLNARIHPSSSLARKRPRLVLFSDLVMTSALYMRDVTVIEDDWLRQAAPHYCSGKAIGR